MQAYLSPPRGHQNPRMCGRSMGEATGHVSWCTVEWVHGAGAVVRWPHPVHVGSARPTLRRPLQGMQHMGLMERLRPVQCESVTCSSCTMGLDSVGLIVHWAPTAGEGSCVFFFPLTNFRWPYYWMTGNFAVCSAQLPSLMAVCAFAGSSGNQRGFFFINALAHARMHMHAHAHTHTHARTLFYYLAPYTESAPPP